MVGLLWLLNYCSFLLLWIPSYGIALSSFDLLSRRTVVANTITPSATGWLLSSSSQHDPPGHRTSWETSPENTNERIVISQCQGQVLPERAIPGAYDNECMQLPQRTLVLPTAVTTDPRSIVLQILQQPPAAGSTGLSVWNSSLILCRILKQVMESNTLAWQQSTTTTTVAELGCGTGLVSLYLAAALQQQQQKQQQDWHSTSNSVNIWATDGNPSVVDLARQNIDRNRPQWEGKMNTSHRGSPATLPRRIQVQAVFYRWGEDDPSDVMVSSTGEDVITADWVLGSDLTYSPGSWPLLVDSMQQWVTPQTGTILYVSCGHGGFSSASEMEGFLTVAQAKGLVVVPPSQWPWWTTAAGKDKKDGSFPNTRSIHSQRPRDDSLSNEDNARRVTGNKVSWLLQSSLITVEEAEILNANGGVQIVAMRRKS